MRKGLFRQQALAFQNSRLQGDILLIPKLSMQVIVSLLLAWLAVVTWYLFSSHYSRQTTVTGWLEPPQGVIRLYADANSGNVQRLLVKDGQRVEKGQPLMIIDSASQMASGGSLENTLLDEYQKQIALLSSQIARIKTINKRKFAQLKNTIASLEQDLTQLKDLKLLTQERLNIAKEQQEAISKLASHQNVAQQESRSARASYLSILQELKQLEREYLSNAQALEEKQLLLVQFPAESANTLAGLQSSLSDINQRVAQISSQSRHVIKASMSGIVSNLQVNEGQYVGNNLPLLTLLPFDLKIEARMLIPVRAAGFVQQGQPIDLRYDAFPYQKFGLHKGKVTAMSNTVILPGELTNSPVAVNEPVYLVRAQLEDQQVTAFGNQVPLKSGMTFSADITLAERTLVEWLFEPLLSLTGRL
ncbi:HlyD family efflux transporter periplasmic adaptor subunit [Alteromonas pelagimontana]|uniref:HlyD family efflux transporter periplasmic adaptor subunit n=1 Tax=Alteromonas pelagimontana TaxID=1858656 RepID=A0A6M4ME51_9ALTE|nr:HlyD family efflux transporter periplasmic adaptor subunit [Alteromonas pelagimontana]QJR81471.1 HlyD family efflux transporter periplasmic adaptor subunit [Alteromonas pelagimontana]